MRYATGLALFGLSLSLSGCTSFREEQIVGVVESRPGNNQNFPAQYYRITVEGSSTLQRTEFQSGWYDADAVDALFSEVTTKVSERNVIASTTVVKTDTKKPDPKKPDAKKPDAKKPDAKKPDAKKPDAKEAAGTAVPPSPDSAARDSGDKPPRPVTTASGAPPREFLVFGPRGTRVPLKNKRFVIFAANNPKQIVNQIDALTTSQETAKLLGHMMKSSDTEDLRRLEESKASDNADRLAFLARIDAEIARLKTVQDAADDAVTGRDTLPSRYWSLIEDLLHAAPAAR